MSSGPFDINLVVARLQELDPQPFSQIGTIVEYSKVTDLSGFAMPGAYVLMGPERGIPGNGARAQMAEAVIGIAISVRNYGMGAEGLTHEVNPLIGQVRDHRNRRRGRLAPGSKNYRGGITCREQRQPGWSP